MNDSNIPEHLKKERNEDKNDNILEPVDMKKRNLSSEGKRFIKESIKDKIKPAGLPRNKSKEKSSKDPIGSAIPWQLIKVVERTKLWKTLDINGNGLLSLNELTI